MYNNWNKKQNNWNENVITWIRSEQAEKKKISKFEERVIEMVKSEDLEEMKYIPDEERERKIGENIWRIIAEDLYNLMQRAYTHTQETKQATPKLWAI